VSETVGIRRDDGEEVGEEVGERLGLLKPQPVQTPKYARTFFF
jgi:hypothetical protein